MNIADIAVLVNARLFNQHRFFNRGDGVQGFVLNFDQVHCVEGDVFINRSNRGYRITDEANLVDAECVFVLANRKDAIRNRHVFASNNGEYPGECQCL